MQTSLPLDTTIERSMFFSTLQKAPINSTVNSKYQKLQPQVDALIHQDEWKLFQADAGVDTLQGIKDIKEYVMQVFQQLFIYGKSCCHLIPLVVKAGLGTNKWRISKTVFQSMHFLPSEGHPSGKQQLLVCIHLCRLFDFTVQ